MHSSVIVGTNSEIFNFCLFTDQTIKICAAPGRMAIGPSINIGDWPNSEEEAELF